MELILHLQFAVSYLQHDFLESLFVVIVTVVEMVVLEFAWVKLFEVEAVVFGSVDLVAVLLVGFVL